LQEVCGGKKNERENGRRSQGKILAKTWVCVSHRKLQLSLAKRDNLPTIPSLAGNQKVILPWVYVHLFDFLIED